MRIAIVVALLCPVLLAEEDRALREKATALAKQGQEKGRVAVRAQLQNSFFESSEMM